MAKRTNFVQFFFSQYLITTNLFWHKSRQMKRMRKRTEERKKREYSLCIILYLLVLTGYCIDLRQQTVRVICRGMCVITEIKKILVI